jgi:gamma-glutamyltranspeptidase/glutathione hydrolase
VRIASAGQLLFLGLAFNLSAEYVVNMPRFHHQLHPVNQITHHPGISNDVIEALQKMGYETVERSFGDLHVIIRTLDGLTSASEARGRGSARVAVK